MYSLVSIKRKNTKRTKLKFEKQKNYETKEKNICQNFKILVQVLVLFLERTLGMNRIRANLLIESRFQFVCLFDGLFRVVFFWGQEFRISLIVKNLGEKWWIKVDLKFCKKNGFALQFYGGLGIIAYWWVCIGKGLRIVQKAWLWPLLYNTQHHTLLYCTCTQLHCTELYYTTVLYLLYCTVLYCTVLQYTEMNCTLLIYTAAASLPSGGQLWPLMQREGRRTL